ncbi:helix-turn-helix transcriptional regulator [Frankia sp. Cr1]|uniref:helix-turn-helix domain-containing protein n=1 Tax=Frankia sp. Cr1 TaxID=3073931 RepID=UPI002AD50D4F|nr:helix-turn-helix transcriptional regulator [Frankia sp. Cr1]
MEDLRTRLGAEIRRLREAAGLSQEELSDQLGYAAGRNYVSRIENGRDLASEEWTRAVDQQLGANGSLVALRFEVWRTDQLRRIEEKATVLGVDSAVALAAPSQQGEEDGVDRRQMLQAGCFTTAVVAADLSNQIAAADPSPFTLHEISIDLHRIAETYNTTPRAQLVPRVEAGWLGVEKLLDTRISAKLRKRLTGHAGWYAYYLGTLAFDLGHDQATGAYLSLAGQHATEASDRLLAGSVAAMDSAFAYFNRQYALAADIAAEARPHADPHIRPFLAANEARASAMARRPEPARVALEDMQTHALASDATPGPTTIDEEGVHSMLAVVLAHLGDGEAAAAHAGRSLELLSGTGQFGETGGTYNALCRAFLRRPDPDPEQAAAAAHAALTVIDGRPVRWVIQSTAQLWREMERRWPELPAVQDLGEVLVSSRKALAPALV